MIKVKVECKLEIEIELPDKYYLNPDGTIDEKSVRFYVEDNGCPGTGSMGNVIDKTIEEHDANGTCWACALKGENKVLSITKI